MILSTVNIFRLAQHRVHNRAFLFLFPCQDPKINNNFCTLRDSHFQTSNSSMDHPVIFWCVQGRKILSLKNHIFKITDQIQSKSSVRFISFLDRTQILRIKLRKKFITINNQHQKLMTQCLKAIEFQKKRLQLYNKKNQLIEILYYFLEILGYHLNIYLMRV